MVAYWGIPPLTDCMGLGHAVFSYCGRISLSAIADRAMMNDPGFYIECLNESYEEMLEAAHKYEAEKNNPAAKKAVKKRTAKKTSSSASAKPDVKTNAAKTSEDDAQDKPKRKRAARKKATSSKKASSKAQSLAADLVDQAEAKSAPLEKTSTESSAA